MAKTKGMTAYECDRCGAKEFLTEDAPGKADWHDVARTTADGAERTVLMCAGCYASYRSLVESEDRDFNAFMANGVGKGA